MLGVVATLRVKPGMEAEFEALATQLVTQVRAYEPGHAFDAGWAGADIRTAARRGR